MQRKLKVTRRGGAGNVTGSVSDQERSGTTGPSSPAMNAATGRGPKASDPWDPPARPSVNERRRSLLLGLLLLGFGAYQSVLYFGFHPVPNSDFCAFVKTGEELLSFHLPSSYKRAPVLCVLLVGLSRIMGGPHPELTAGWLLNGVLHPLNLLLFWLIGRDIFGRSAVLVAIVAILNPWSMDLLADPIAETTLLFFTLLTLYLISKRSKWAYLAASVTTMVRYEGAALIVAALVADLLEKKARGDRARAARRAALASVPLGLWMLGTYFSLRAVQAGSGHYLQEMGAFSGGKFVIVEFAKLLSQVVFCPLVQLWPGSPDWATGLTHHGTMVAGLACLGIGTLLGVLRRERVIVATSIFLWPYLLVHAVHSYVAPRFCATIAGITLIVAWYAVESAWSGLDADRRLPTAGLLGAQGLVVVAAAMWLGTLLLALPSVAASSQRSASVPYVGVALVAVILAVQLVTDRGRRRLGLVAASVVACLAIVSNQFTLVRVLGDGQSGVEYRALADWFRKNARPGEGIVCANTCAVELYAPERKSDVTHFFNVKASSPSEFVERCREKKIAYVAWDSDTGQSIGSYYYRLFRYENVEALREPKSRDPYEFIRQIDSERGNRLNVFRILKTPPGETGR